MSTRSTSTRRANVRGFAEAAASELRCQAEQLREELGRVLLATEDAQAAAAEAKPAGGAPAMIGGRAGGGARAVVLGGPTGAGDGRVRGARRRGRAPRAPWPPGSRSRAGCRTGPWGRCVQSSSAAGKSTLADAALSLVPPEAKVAYSAMTGQALYYLGDTDLAHKVLADRRGGGGVAGHLPAEAARLRRAPFDRGGRQGPGHAAAWSPTPTRWPAPWRCS